MQDTSIDGIGRIYGGEYGTILVNGMGKLKGDAICEDIVVNGTFKTKGRLEAGRFECNGISRIFRKLKVRKLEVNGMVKLRRATLEAEQIQCQGAISSNRSLSADQIYIDGLCWADAIYGEQIYIKSTDLQHNGIRFPTTKGPKFLATLYLGRKISIQDSIVEEIACTQLVAEKLKSRIIRADTVTLRNGCIVDRIECRILNCDETCTISKADVQERNNMPVKMEMEGN